MALTEIASNVRTNPLDAVERMASVNDWTFERACEDEINILIPALNSTFRVKIFASNTTMIAAFSQEFTVNGEATLAQMDALWGEAKRTLGD